MASDCIDHGTAEQLPRDFLAGQRFQHAVLEAVENLPLRAVPDVLARLLRSTLSRDPRRDLRKFFLGLVVGDRLANNQEFHRAAKEEGCVDHLDADPIDLGDLFTELRG